MQNREQVMAAIDQVLNKKPDKFKPVKDYLYQVKDAIRQVKLIAAKIEIQEESIGIHGMSYGEQMPGNKDFTRSAVESSVVALDLLKKEREKAKKNYIDAKVAVSEFISTLEDVNQQTVVMQKYVCGQDWEKIAKDMGMSVRTVQRLHGKALPLLMDELEKRKAA